MTDILRRLGNDESGQDMAEYALLLALIALLLVVVIGAFRDAVGAKFDAASSALNNVS
jgi:Flp pilus assembly pilin Flp